MMASHFLSKIASLTTISANVTVAATPLITTSQRHFSKKRLSPRKQAEQRQREEYQVKQYAKMQETLRQKEEEREKQRLQAKYREEAQKSDILDEQFQQLDLSFAARPEINMTTNNPAVTSDGRVSTKKQQKKRNPNDLFRAGSKNVMKEFDTTVKANATSGHFQADEEDSKKYTPREEDDEDPDKLTSHDIIYSLNGLIATDLLDVVHKSHLNLDIMERANVVSRVTDLFTDYIDAYNTDVLRPEMIGQYSRKLFTASLNIIENHPSLIPKFLSKVSLSDLFQFISINANPSITREEEIQNRLLSLALIGSICHNHPDAASLIVESGFLPRLFKVAVDYQPRGHFTGNLEHDIEISEASETYVEVERVLKIIATELQPNSSQLRVLFVPELLKLAKLILQPEVDIFNSKREQGESYFITHAGTLRLLSLIQSLGYHFDTHQSTATLDIIAENFLQNGYFPLFMNHFEYSQDETSVIFHRLIALCMMNKQSHLDLFTRSRYSAIARARVSAANETSRETLNGVLVSVHIASIRSILERNPRIRGEYIDKSVFIELLQVAYQNTEFPIPDDPTTGLPYSTPPPGHPFPVLSIPMYFSVLDLLHLLSYQGYSNELRAKRDPNSKEDLQKHEDYERALPIGFANNLVEFVTAIMPLSAEHAYVGLRIILAIVDQPNTQAPFEENYTFSVINHVSEKFGPTNSTIRFYCIALLSSTYSSCSTDFIINTCHENMIPTIVQGVQTSSIEIARHAFNALGRIVAILESKDRSKLMKNKKLSIDSKRSAIPYRRLMIASGIFDNIRLILTSKESKVTDELRITALQFMVNFFLHPPQFHRDILTKEAFPLFSYAVGEGSSELANTSAKLVEALCDGGYFEAMMETAFLDACVGRLSKRIPIVEYDENGEEIQMEASKVKYQPDYSLLELYKFVTSVGESLSANAMQSAQQEQIDSVKTQEEIKMEQQYAKETEDFMKYGPNDGQVYGLNLRENGQMPAFDGMDNPNVDEHDVDVHVESEKRQARQEN